MHRALQPNLTTFKVSKKKPEKVAYYEPESRTLSTGDTISKLTSECSSVLKIGDLKQKEIIQASPLSTNSHLVKRGLIGVVIQAWQHHHNLTLRPDDIWTALMVQFSFYVNANAKTLRSSFVSHRGKKNMGIEVESLTQVKTDRPKLVELITRMIDSNLVDRTVKDWVIPNFSTTTDEDRMVCGSVLMATMKSCCLYRLLIGCGIPSITLDGTVEDWQNIKNRISKFRRYELNDWADMLDEILEQFVQAKKGKVDVKFWDKICHWDGGDMYNAPELSGWITAFYVFNKKGKWQGEAKKGQRWPIIHYNEADGYVTVDIVLQDLLQKRVLNTTLYAGHLGHEIVDNGFGLQPKVGWMLALVGQREMKATELAKLSRETTEETLKPAKRRCRNNLDFLLDVQ